jgi:hypothetical protein
MLELLAVADLVARNRPTRRLVALLVSAAGAAESGCDGDLLAASGTRDGSASDAALTVDAPGGEARPAGTVSFAADVFPIVAASCALADCHATGTTLNHLTDFSTAASTYRRWVNGPGFDFCPEVSSGLFVTKTIVVPGDPEGSYLVEKITSTREDLCRDGHHPRMPPPPWPALSAAQIALVSTWIRQGAADD